MPPQLTKAKLKQRMKENYERLERTDLEAFRVTAPLEISSSFSCISLDTMSLRSTNSSDSGPLTSWEHAWSLTNNLSTPSKIHTFPSLNDLSSNVRVKSPRNKSNSPCTSRHSGHFKGREANSSVQHISDACFLRSGYGLIVAEPFENRIQVFSNKRHTLLATLTHNNTSKRLLIVLINHLSLGMFERACSKYYFFSN